MSWISPGPRGRSRLARSLAALLAATVLPWAAHAAPLDLSTVESVAQWFTHYYEAPQPKLVSKAARNRMIAMLDQARGRKVFDLTTKGVSAIAAALTDSRRAASRQSASKPRNGRK